ncbi:hypothetical protein LY76DRAFT_590828 [Colletotrichum caudatum]|nr:hypothetical protein LY76DRAFT_590828 [Colletotrichum caudatum]
MPLTMGRCLNAMVVFLPVILLVAIDSRIPFSRLESRIAIVQHTDGCTPQRQCSRVTRHRILCLSLCQ